MQIESPKLGWIESKLKVLRKELGEEEFEKLLAGVAQKRERL